MFKEIDRIKVKGKDEAVQHLRAARPGDRGGQEAQDELKLWHQTLRAYRAQQWDQVEVSLLNLQRMNPACELYALYAERVTQFRRNRRPRRAGTASQRSTRNRRRR